MSSIGRPQKHLANPEHTCQHGDVPCVIAVDCGQKDHSFLVQQRTGRQEETCEPYAPLSKSITGLFRLYHRLVYTD